MKFFTSKEVREKFYLKIKSKYRFVIMNNDTFEEKFSFRLSPLNIFVTIGSTVILLIIATTYIIAFTPLREYIPGYANVHIQEGFRSLKLKVDSIEETTKEKDLYIQNIKNIIQGSNIEEHIPETYKNIQEENDLIKDKDKNKNIGIGENVNTNILAYLYFFKPVNGIISNFYNPSDNHYGIDIVTKQNEYVKSVLKGTVIFSDWTNDGGNVIIIQHEANILSVYKHNSMLLKKAGEYVEEGVPIAIVGNTGQITTGLHLHFELWYDSNPVNPQDYINFN